MPEQFSKESLYRRASADFKRADSHSASWRQDALTHFKLVAGDQWRPEDKKFLEKQKRPVTTFNMIAPNIHAVSGLEQGNRQEIKFLPREKGDMDQRGADIYNQGAKWIADTTDAEFEHSEAFYDMLVCGMGWTQMRMEYDEDPDGVLRITCLDPLKKWWDPAAKKHNLLDRRFDFTIVDMDRDEFEAMFPEFDGEPAGNVFGRGIDSDISPGIERENRPDNYKGDDSSPRDGGASGKIRVAEYNFFAWEPLYSVSIPGSEQPVRMRQEKFDVMKKQMGIPFITIEKHNKKPPLEPHAIYNTQKIKRFYRAWFSGSECVDWAENADPNHFTDFCVTAYINKADSTWSGLVEPMVSPQEWANKMFSQILHTVNSNAKGGVFAFEDSFVNPRQAERDYAKPDAVIMLNKIAGGSIDSVIRERTPAPYPQAMGQILDFTITIIPRVTGINFELLGLSGKDQPGILESMRKQAGMTILAPLFDSLRHYRKLIGRSMIHFMREHIGTDRLKRLVIAEDAQFVDQAMLPDVSRYDVHVDESPQSPNMKTLIFKLILDIASTMPQIAESIMDLALQYSPLPQHLSAEMAKRIQASKQPDPLVQKGKELAMQELAAKAAERESNAGVSKVKAGLVLEQARVAEATVAKTMAETNKLDAEAELMEYDTVGTFAKNMKTARQPAATR